MTVSLEKVLLVGVDVDGAVMLVRGHIGALHHRPVAQQLLLRPPLLRLLHRCCFSLFFLISSPRRFLFLSRHALLREIHHALLLALVKPVDDLVHAGVNREGAAGLGAVEGHLAGLKTVLLLQVAYMRIRHLYIIDLIAYK